MLRSGSSSTPRFSGMGMPEAICQNSGAYGKCCFRASPVPIVIGIVESGVQVTPFLRTRALQCSIRGCVPPLFWQARDRWRVSFERPATASGSTTVDRPTPAQVLALACGAISLTRFCWCSRTARRCSAPSPTPSPSRSSHSTAIHILPIRRSGPALVHSGQTRSYKVGRGLPAIGSLDFENFLNRPRNHEVDEGSVSAAALTQPWSRRFSTCWLQPGDVPYSP